MKTIKNILAFAFNDETGIICSFIVVLAAGALLWFVPMSVIPNAYFNPAMISLCSLLVILAIRLFVLCYKNR